MVNGDGNFSFAEVASEWDEVRNWMNLGQLGVPYTQKAMVYLRSE